MEPLAAFGLAANILQVVDFSAKLLSAGHQIYQAGSTVQNAELALVAQDLRSLNNKLKMWARPDQTALGPLTQDRQALEELACESESIAQELIAILSSLQVEGKRTRYKSYQHAIKTMWKRSKLDETTRRLEFIREQLQLRVLVSMKTTVDTIALRNDGNLASLDKGTQEIVKTILDNRDNLAVVVSAQTEHLAKQHEISEASAIARHKEVIENFSKFSGSSRDTREKPEDTLRAIKAGLYYSRLTDRFDDVVQAHRETFEWIYREPQKEQPSWSNFGKWLREENGVYWISGKAGSGKSTMMKFISQDPRLKTKLQEWARDTPLVIASFYFWSAGTELQRTQEGLFRSLLFETLTQQPSLAPVLFPECYDVEAHRLTFPTFHQLRRAFQRLMTYSTTPLKVALLVDGLDEFDAVQLTMTELADMFLIAGQSENVKAILSSRPLSAFESSFKNQPKLRLHDLTRGDITIYVEDKIRRHARVTELSREDPTGAEELVSELVSAASGVFLWVKLVVRSLLEGFQNYDTLSDLRQRLSALPRELEDLFTAMLHKIPTEYKVESSKMFQILRCHGIVVQRKSLRLSLTTADLFFALLDQAIVIQAKTEPLTLSDCTTICAEVEGKLRSRCAGLVELRPRPGFSSAGTLSLESVRDLNIVQYGPEVGYLHRSVADYMENEEAWAVITNSTRGSDFDPNVALLRSSVMKIKRSYTSEFTDLFVIPFGLPLVVVRNTVWFAQASEKSTAAAQEELLDEVDMVMSMSYQNIYPVGSVQNSELRQRNLTTWCDSYNSVTGQRISLCHDSFLALAIQEGLFHYVYAKFSTHGPSLIKKAGKPLLHYACLSSWPDEQARSQIVLLLLRNGADPLEVFDDTNVHDDTLKILVEYVSTLQKGDLKSEVNRFIVRLEGQRTKRTIRVPGFLRMCFK
ncbi:hypothetical protein BDV95DRAFT_353084 [Massariosphaeria phaeospora]|uniref:Uncharacterized protein n=1 Tax=Massariosphaeria phaeospora TaxID=100035 RepID=A0A7C8ICK3_9PLEO|nr:hypothetical protein BDV95DRAFT_353084 [Massariosphaeria phaeospora]